MSAQPPEGLMNKAPEFEPPQACVSRIIKNVLPDNVQITKDARAAFTRAAGIFIFYLTHCANDFSKEKKRQTIYTEDVLHALRELDFAEFQTSLEAFLKVYKEEVESGKKVSGATRKKGDDDEEDAGAADDDQES
jgi:DNA polymerase epsilon subunit 3